MLNQQSVGSPIWFIRDSHHLAVIGQRILNVGGKGQIVTHIRRHDTCMPPVIWYTFVWSHWPAVYLCAIDVIDVASTVVTGTLLGYGLCCVCRTVFCVSVSSMSALQPVVKAAELR